MSTSPQWGLTFVLPNLRLGEHERFPSEVTLGLEGIAIVPASDSRVVEIREWCEPADRFLGSFHDGYGTAITPAALIVREDWHSGIVAHPEAVISFRSASSSSSILPFRAQWQDHGWAGVWWSESFDCHPARLRPDGSKFNYRTPALNSIGFRLDGLQFTPDLRVPRPHLMHTDENLADRLGRAWWHRYGRKRDKQKTAKVFRSLEAAYDALGRARRQSVRQTPPDGWRRGSATAVLGLNHLPHRTFGFLDRHWPQRVTSSQETTSWAELLRQHVRDNHAVYEDHLLNAIGKSYWD